MKKVVIMLISTICLFTALFAGCGSGGSNSKEINVTGEQVMAGTLRRWISDRQETYYEKDIANEIEYHWFDFEMEMLFENYQMENDESSKITVEYELDGKMGIKYPLTTLWGSTVSLLYDFEIDVKAKNETIDENGNREVETVRMKGDVIYVDNICYADLTIESISASGEYKESTKTQGSLSDILDLEAGDITEILGAEADSEARIYGISIDALLDSVASQSGVYYYLDEDNNTFYIDYEKAGGTSEYRTQNELQYEIEFAEESAVVKKEKAYLKEYYSVTSESYGVTQTQEANLEIWLAVKRRSSGKIEAPSDADLYEKI